MRRALFDVTLIEPLDGRTRARLVITVDAHGRGSATVTPFRSRESYTLGLAEAVRCIAWRAAKHDAAARGFTAPRPRRSR